MVVHRQAVSSAPRISGHVRRRRQQAQVISSVADSRKRPRRPSNVRLVGQLQGSGFIEPQWLIQRDNRFIQVPELLFRVTAAANGHRTLKQLADHLTKTTDWIISPELVQQVIETKLAPLGIIETDSNVTAAMGEKRSNSPMAIKVRTSLLGPRVIEPISTVLQAFFVPPILVAVLVVIAVAHWWLYAVHGVGDAIRAAMFTPGFLPLSLLVLIAANVFHEFGHAAALHYGGGKVRSMGAGIYLIWPMLYTDVTDSYRLGRRARLRTDLGGVYFHLIAAAAIVELYLITGHEYLLMTVLLISVQVVGQFIPFARMDGYWVIADLTGIPDFFSQIKPFLRSISRGRWKGSQLPPLKWWAKVVFAAYIVITLPVLAFLLTMMVRHLPTLATMSWDALLYQEVEFSIARSAGSVPMMAAIGMQVIFLLLQLLGVVLILFGVARVPIALVRTALRAGQWRLAGAMAGATLAVVFVLAQIWTS